MKNFSCSFSKVCLFSLFVGSLLIFGCGESNPSGITTDDTSTSTTTTTTTSNSANAVEASPCRVYGQVISADDTNVKSPANIKVAFKNIATNVITDNSGNSPDTRDAFDFNLVAWILGETIIAKIIYIIVGICGLINIGLLFNHIEP